MTKYRVYQLTKFVDRDGVEEDEGWVEIGTADAPGPQQAAIAVSQHGLRLPADLMVVPARNTTAVRLEEQASVKARIVSASPTGLTTPTPEPPVES